MSVAMIPSGGYRYTHADIRKATGVTSRALNYLVARYHLERGQAGGRPKGLAKPRKQNRA